MATMHTKAGGYNINLPFAHVPTYYYSAYT
ncbi:MAG: hypothetical protein JWR23_3326 [Mucilaginibacter sp.]|nr:hypothetical protein [Mucilaginibacter sp.]